MLFYVIHVNSFLGIPEGSKRNFFFEYYRNDLPNGEKWKFKTTNKTTSYITDLRLVSCRHYDVDN